MYGSYNLKKVVKNQHKLIWYCTLHIFRQISGELSPASETNNTSNVFQKNIRK